MIDATPERWLPVVGWEGLYEISDLGRVRSLPRQGSNGHWYGGGYLKPGIGGGGYPYVNLCKNNAGRRLRIHVLIAAAFIGPRPDGYEIRHLDGNPANSVLVNLAYGTHSENARDTVRHGAHSEARKTHCKRGHEFTPENTSVDKRGGRRCRRCKRLRTWKLRGKEPDSPRRRPTPITHCQRGHEMTPENTYIRPDNGRRTCRACIKLRRPGPISGGSLSAPATRAKPVATQLALPA